MLVLPSEGQRNQVIVFRGESRPCDRRAVGDKNLQLVRYSNKRGPICWRSNPQFGLLLAWRDSLQLGAEERALAWREIDKVWQQIGCRSVLDFKEPVGTVFTD